MNYWQTRWNFGLDSRAIGISCISEGSFFSSRQRPEQLRYLVAALSDGAKRLKREADLSLPI
jgi:hypothetical protein